jgi:hypothetical protein
MVQKQGENERAKAEAILQRLEKRLHQKAANEAAKKAREWRNKVILNLLYTINKEGGGRLLKRA